MLGALLLLRWSRFSSNWWPSLNKKYLLPIKPLLPILPLPPKKTITGINNSVFSPIQDIISTSKGHCYVILMVGFMHWQRGSYLPGTVNVGGKTCSSLECISQRPEIHLTRLVYFSELLIIRLTQNKNKSIKVFWISVRMVIHLYSL